MDDARKPETEPATRANIARAFVAIEELKRLIRGAPSVKPIEADLVKKKRKPAPTEPILPE